MRRTSRWRMGLAVLGCLSACDSSPRDASLSEEEPASIPLPPEPPPAPVESPPEPSAARLCGPARRPCTVQLQEPVANLPGAGSWVTPTLVLDAQRRPHVFGAGAFEPSRGGVLAMRSSSGDWSVQQLPADWTGAAFGLSTGGAPLVTRAQDTGPDAPSELWEWTEEGWHSKARLGTRLLPWLGVSALRTDGTGALHALLRTDEAFPRPVYVSESNGWTPRLLGSGGRISLLPGFALAPGGGAHAAYWEYVKDRWLLSWQSLSSPPERVLSLPDPGWPADAISGSRIRVAVTTPGSPRGPETAHLFFIRPQDALRGYSEVAYATRTGEGAWTTHTLVRDQLLTPRCVDTPPTEQRRTCEEESIVHWPGPLVATPGEVRLFIPWVRTRVQLGARCAHGTCQWQSEDWTHTYGLDLSWVEEGTVQTVPLSQGVERLRLWDAQADLEGRIHLLGQDESSWRYLILGAP